MDTALYIKENTDKNDSVLQIGNEINLYILSDRQYNGKYFYQLPVALYSEEITNEFLNELNNKLPVIIVDTRAQQYQKLNNRFNKEVNNILNKYYNTDNQLLYTKKGESNE